MNIDYMRLADNWQKWAGLLRFSNAATEADTHRDEILFKSSEVSYRLREEASWWLLDELNDRNQWQNKVGTFSSFDLVEKYLIWNWASLARSAVGALNLGSRLYAQGFSKTVAVEKISAGTYEMTSPVGTVILPLIKATIFSHLILEPVQNIEQLVSSGLD